MSKIAKAQDLLEWYDCHRRLLPWRAIPGEKVDPYAIWLSEIMLQQTTVTAVKPYYEKFLSRWPTISLLAAADIAEVLTEWAGLGYYARARNLHACAQVVRNEYRGIFPADEKDLRTLPGIGEYTAAAIAAIAYGQAAVVVDGNVERVMARLFAVDQPLPRSKSKLRDLASRLTPQYRSGDYAQAVMDLGATICKPKSPSCGICPWQKACMAHKLGLTADLPRRLPKRRKPNRLGVCFWLTRPDGAILLRRRPEKGLLGGMMEVPSTPWRETLWTSSEAIKYAPIKASPNKWRCLPGDIFHSFSHFRLQLAVEMAPVTAMQAVSAEKQVDLNWVCLDSMTNHALPSLMVKVVKHVDKVGY